jgi:outer membrane protein insertion porin family
MARFPGQWSQKAIKVMIDPKKLMRGAVLALAILVAAPLMGVSGSFIGVEAAQAANVGKIVVSGNRLVDTPTVVSYLALKPGEAITPAKISASINALYGTGLFKTVNVTQSGGTVSVKVTENPVVASVLFEGNQRFTDANLLAMVNTASRGTYTADRLQTDVASIKNAYDQAGYNSVTVNARTEAVDNGRMRVVFVINEGQRAGIAAINFTGNNAFNAGTLKSVINTKETGILSWLFRDDVYDANKLAVDKELVRLYYANHGFPDAQVTSAVAEYDAKRNGYFINFTINEGDRYKFGKTGIETSIAGLNANDLKDTVQTHEGGRYSFADLQKTAENMAFRATTQGYAFADVRPRIDRDINNHVLNVTYLVDQGPRVYVERINITGNNKTRDFVIRRELDFVEGDPFNRNLVNRGKTAIEALGFFKTVDITTAPGSAPDKVVLDINVVESSTGDYGITAGYSTTDGILGEVSLTERNFLGRGQYVRAAVGASGTGKSFDFSFTEPRFMGLKISSGIDLYHRIVDESSTNYYGTTTTGGQLRFGLPITDTLGTTLFVGYEHKIFADNSAPTSSLVANGDSLNKAFGGYTLAFSTLDNPKKPTSGLYATLTQTYAGWDHNYLKSEAKARYFLPILEDTGLIASVRGQAGIINDFSGAGVRSTEAFNYGGSLVRGFEAQGLGPRLTSGEYLGGTAYAGASAELQFPIPVLPPSYGLSGAIWADAAVVNGTPNMGTGALDPGSVDQPFKSSIGASIIWDSPFGPLRGDFGYAITKATTDRPQIFQLTLQTLL